MSGAQSLWILQPVHRDHVCFEVGIAASVHAWCLSLCGHCSRCALCVLTADARVLQQKRLHVFDRCKTPDFTGSPAAGPCHQPAEADEPEEMIEQNPQARHAADPPFFERFLMRRKHRSIAR